MSSQNSLIMHQNKQKFAICLKHTTNTCIQNLIIHITVPKVWIQSELFKITFVFIKSINNWCTAIIKIRHFPNLSNQCGKDKFFESQINGFLLRVCNPRSRSRKEDSRMSFIRGLNADQFRKKSVKNCGLKPYALRESIQFCAGGNHIKFA